MLDREFSLYLEPYNAVYIDIAKVASSSIKATLALTLNLSMPDGNPHNVVFPHPPQPAATGGRAYPLWYTFAFVRNPWDRLVSCYRDKIGGEVADFTGFAETGVAHCLDRFDAFKANMSFNDFVRAVAVIPDEEADEHFRSQVDYITNAKGVVAIDFVGRYEQLDQDFASVVRQINLPNDTTLPRLQAAKPVNYRSYYTPETEALVATRYARDIQVLNYRF